MRLEPVGLLAIPVLIALNGYFVAAEFSLVAIRRTRVEEMLAKGVRSARAVDYAVTNLDRSIAATQLGITLASLALGWIGEPAMARVIQPWFDFLPFEWKTVSAHAVAFAIAFSAITFMHVIFGELMPKTIALQMPEKTALRVSTPLNLFAWLTRPLIVVMNGIGNWMLKRLGFEPAGTEGAVHSVDELLMLVRDTQEAGLISTDQATFLSNVFRLREKTVRECMLPIEKVDALEISTPREEMFEKVRSWGYTRIPVYEKDRSSIVGILNTKNLFYMLSLSPTLVVLEDALYMPNYIDPDETIAIALRKFQKTRRHMAMVRDRAGTVLGMITLEDVLEEIVGDIEDEADQSMPVIRLPVSPPPVRRATGVSTATIAALTARPMPKPPSSE